MAMAMIYLDHASTTPLNGKVLKAMGPYLKNRFGNASSLHSWGREAREAVEKARQQAAEFLGCLPEEIIFTGSATEADNLAILGTARAAAENGYKVSVITTQIEHPAVLEPCRFLQRHGADVSFLPVNQDGLVDLGRIGPLKTRSKAKVLVLLSIMYANNEVGVIEPIEAIGQDLRKIRQSHPNIKFVFHTDAAQAANYLDCNVNKLGVDLLTLSAHKIYGPKGVGVLYIKKGMSLAPFMFGGHQEKSWRPSTENVAGIVGMGCALSLLGNTADRIKAGEKTRWLRDRLIEGILKKIPRTYLNGSLESRLANNANISFEAAEGESILFALDQAGIAVSTGSACASGSLEPSHVLTAMGFTAERAHGSIRFTLGQETTAAEIDYVLMVLPGLIAKLRKISPLK